MKKLVLIISVIVTFTYAQITPEQALQKLIEGNKRYTSQNFKQKNYPKERQEQSQAQKPYAIILSCSDSRVPPEIIFDESHGQLFIIRNAGNVADEVVLGTIEYGVEHLNSPLLVIMGHSKCGAVTATVKGGELPHNIEAIANYIKPAVAAAKPNSKNEQELINNTIEENITYQIKEIITKSSIVKEFLEQKKIKIVGAHYNIDTGVVEFIDYKFEH
ncbi:MAG TPA: carbonic anhydrase [Ignavibacteriales bacterium]|nr:carbonic anhydrase [Ignavibacteriales bacterium]HOL81548.1 carbonic anhydrase [Ignavibacteriales bacterium]HOM65622.1 carbonic anhydrase [Ignavibacteriales bacterium]HPD67830.1 carbonic anhydrase [Ignavibacteriales bacterium]HPP33662.1 carbonic anhydrase [Ignavibacteriales bacterium]